MRDTTTDEVREQGTERGRDERSGAAVSLLHSGTSFVISDPGLPDCPIVYVNQAFEQMSGYSAAEVVGRNCRFLQGSDTNQPGLDDLRQALKERRPCRTFLRNYKKDGTFFWNDFNLTPIFNSRGEVTFFIGVQNHVTKQELLAVGLTSSPAKSEGAALGPPLLGRLGEILVDQGVVSRATAIAAVQMQRDGNPKRLGEILVEYFAVPEIAIVQALSVQIEDARAQCSQTDLLMKTAFAVRLAQATMGAIPEKGIPIFSLSQPLSDAGGDTFYRLRLEDGTQLLLLADVAGHSVISSYAVAAFLGMFCALSAQMPTQIQTGQLQGLRELFLKLNTCLLNGPFADVPICVLAAHWNVREGRLHIINAGMPHGLCLRKAPGSCRAIEINGNPLGVLPDPAMEEQVIALAEGDRVIFGSDGIFEMLSPEGMLFQDVAAAHWIDLGSRSLGDALGAICALAREHGRGVVSDDLLAVAIEQPAVVRVEHGFRMHLDSTFEAIDTACDRMVGFLHEQPQWNALGAEAEFYLVLAAREALSNAVIHGNGQVRSKSLCFDCRVGSPLTALTMTVTDEGCGFDLEKHAVAADLQTSERGRGITILRSSAQSARMTGGELCLEFDLAAMFAESINKNLDLNSGGTRNE